MQDRKPGDAGGTGTKNCGQAPRGTAALKLWGPCEHSSGCQSANRELEQFRDGLNNHLAQMDNQELPDFEKCFHVIFTRNLPSEDLI